MRPEATENLDGWEKSVEDTLASEKRVVTRKLLRYWTGVTNCRFLYV